MPGRFYVYLLADGPGGWLYVGVTGYLLRRVAEHKAGRLPGYTAGRGIDRLVWFETHSDLDLARLREKRIKRWRRAWKVGLVDQTNPLWADLYDALRAQEAQAEARDRLDP